MEASVDILASDYPPLKTEYSTFGEKFSSLVEEAQQLDIAVGYISEKSLYELTDHIHEKGRPFCNLVIGMHYFERFTRAQYAVAKETEKFLKENKRGTVRIVTSFPYHGKLYSFKYPDGRILSILGSSNLNNILHHKPIRQYELDLLIRDEATNIKLKNFIDSLISVSPDLSSPSLDVFDFREADNFMMEGLTGVRKIENLHELSDLKNSLIKEKSVKIPIKTKETAPRSNINAYFGKGRENFSTGIVRKRPWYEVELIVPKSTTDLPWYPKDDNSEITVITDDGYEFCCKTSGTNSKNFRSADDLKILGKWLKGRLENADALKFDQPVTRETLEKYGRADILMVPTPDENRWFLDFGTSSE